MIQPAGPTCLPRLGPSSKGGRVGPFPRAVSSSPSLSGHSTQAPATWSAQGDGGHEWLRWDKELGDCIYHVEWRFTVVPGKKNYNSGIYARNSADATVWHQAQTGDGSGGYLFGSTTAGGTTKGVNLSKQQSKSRVKPAGEWNVFEITCKGKEMTLWVNGDVTNRWLECEVPKGYVGLEAEGYRIEFRNVKLKPLEGADRSDHDRSLARRVRHSALLWALSHASAIGEAPVRGGELQVGAAMRVITPNPLLPVSGGMGAPNPTREKKGDITARAVVFRKRRCVRGCGLSGRDRISIRHWEIASARRSAAFRLIIS